MMGSAFCLRLIGFGLQVPSIQILALKAVFSWLWALSIDPFSISQVNFLFPLLSDRDDHAIIIMPTCRVLSHSHSHSPQLRPGESVRVVSIVRSEF